MLKNNVSPPSIVHYKSTLITHNHVNTLDPNQCVVVIVCDLVYIVVIGEEGGLQSSH